MACEYLLEKPFEHWQNFFNEVPIFKPVPCLVLSRNSLARILDLGLPLMALTVLMILQGHQRALLDVLMTRNSHLLVVLRDFLVLVLLVRDMRPVVEHMVLVRVLGKMGRQGKRVDQG